MHSLAEVNIVGFWVAVLILFIAGLILSRPRSEEYNARMKNTLAYSLTMEEHGAGEFSCRLGEFTATGATPTEAFDNLAKRIKGTAPSAQMSLWATQGISSQARGSSR